MRGALILSISLAVFVSSAAVGAVSADAAREAARGAPARNGPSPRQGQAPAAQRRPGGAGGPLSAKSGATSQAHAALRQRMLGQIQRPATAASAPIRSAANVRPVTRLGPGVGGGRPGTYRPLPGHGALGGPTTIRPAAKGVSGVRQRP
jgi:hypothetical protein